MIITSLSSDYINRSSKGGTSSKKRKTGGQRSDRFKGRVDEADEGLVFDEGAWVASAKNDDEPLISNVEVTQKKFTINVFVEEVSLALDYPPRGDYHACPRVFLRYDCS